MTFPRRRQFESSLEQMLWKLKFEEIEFLSKHKKAGSQGVSVQKALIIRYDMGFKILQPHGKISAARQVLYPIIYKKVTNHACEDILF